MLDHTKLFDFIKIIFTNQKHLDGLNLHDKRRHHFMINRFFAIKHPTTASLFNVNGISGEYVVESWIKFASGFNRVPGWIYTKTKKQPNNAKSSKNQYEPSERAIEIYLDKCEIGNKEYNDILKYNKIELYDDLKNIDKQIKTYG